MSLFNLPDFGHIGTAARLFICGPRIANFDLSLHKTVRLSESRTLEVRMEAFNVSMSSTTHSSTLQWR